MNKPLQLKNILYSPPTIAGLKAFITHHLHYIAFKNQRNEYI